MKITPFQPNNSPKSVEKRQQKEYKKHEKLEQEKLHPYKKKFKPYFILACFLFVIGFMIGNLIYYLPGNDILAKEQYLFSDSISKFIDENIIRFLTTINIFSLVSGLLFFLLGLFAYVYHNDKGAYRINEEYGSGRLATYAEMQKYRDSIPENNMILSKNVQVSLFNSRLPQKLQKNKSVMVLGDSGAAKTLAFIKTNLLQMNASFITTDPDGGIVYEVGKMMEENGYKVKVLDLNSLSNSDTFNVFHYIKTELDIDRVLDAITEGTKTADNQGEDFWIKAEALLIRSFIAYLWFDGKDNNYTPNLGMISDMLRHVRRDDPKEPSPVEEWFEEQNELHPDNYAYRQWSLFNDLYEAETRASVLGIAASRYSVFDHDQLRDIIRNDSMDIESWNEEKTAVFIAIPESNKAYNFIASIFMATAMDTLRFKSDQVRLGKRKLAPGKKLLHVRFMIDEFANIGRFPNFEAALASFRKREMSFVVILQSLAQLRKMYKNNWEEIVDNCASLLYLGGEDAKTLEFLTKRLGKQTISQRKQNISNNKGGGSENRDKTGREIFMTDELATIDGDNCFVFIKKERGFLDKKYYAYEHPNAYMLGREPGDANWYNYKRYMSEEEEIMDKISRGQSELIDHGTIESQVA